jgi:hypothetical protein
MKKTPQDVLRDQLRVYAIVLIEIEGQDTKEAEVARPELLAKIDEFNRAIALLDQHLR